MIILVCALVSLATVPLSGGRLRRMADLPLRHSWLIWASLLIQTALVSAPWTTSEAVGAVIHIGTYVLAGAFAALNLRLPMAWVIALGGALNLAAILANGGVMPAAPGALRLAGKSAEPGFTNSGAVDGAQLAWLGDVFAIPSTWPLANVFSVGDVIIVVGLTLLAHTWCRVRAASTCDAQPSSTVVVDAAVGTP